MRGPASEQPAQEVTFEFGGFAGHGRTRLSGRGRIPDQSRPPSHQRGRVSSKADDFDVRYRDVGTAGHGRPAADGGYRGNAADVDYDLGYDAEGWDTQGFRRPEADFLDSHEPGHAGGIGGGAGSDRAEDSHPADATGAVGTAVRPDHGRTLRGRRDGSHAHAPRRHRGDQPAGRESEATGAPADSRGPRPRRPRRRPGWTRRTEQAARPAGLRRTGAPRAGPDQGQGQGQLVAALDVAEGRGRAAGGCRRRHRARRHRGGRGL